MTVHFLGRLLQGVRFERRRWIGRLRGDTLIFVTGADKTHAKSLVQLLGSIRAFEPDLSVVVYDLGLHPDQREEARQAFPCRIETFDFNRYPLHLNIRVNKGQYAWKPVIIDEVARNYGGSVCWMDAGNVLIGNLSALRAGISQHGFYSPYSSGTVSDWTHPKMLAWFGLGPDWEGYRKRNLNGACVCFDTRNARASALLAEWARLALIEACIAPPGSNRKNHRQDQALLTVLAYRSGMEQHLELGFRIHADID